MSNNGAVVFVNCRSSSNPQIAPRMVRTISNLHGGSLPRDAHLSDYDTTGEFVILSRDARLSDYDTTGEFVILPRDARLSDYDTTGEFVILS